MTKKVTNFKSYIEERIKVDTNGCWIWQKAKNQKGYGIALRSHLAHRVAYKAFIGDIPKGVCVCHTCDNPSCCNPKHLWLGSNYDNVQDKVTKKRQSKPIGETNPNRKLTFDQVLEIRKKWKPYKYTQKMLAAEYGVSHLHIHDLIHGNVYTKRN